MFTDSTEWKVGSVVEGLSAMEGNGMNGAGSDPTLQISLHDLPSSILVPEDERALVQQVLRDIETLQTGLGAERERFHKEMDRLHRALDAEQSRGEAEERRMVHAIIQARHRYRNLIDMLTQKYVRRPGKFDFRPEIGAFVERESTSASRDRDS